jgi:hypothetical protein
VKPVFSIDSSFMEGARDLDMQKMITCQRSLSRIVADKFIPFRLMILVLSVVVNACAPNQPATSVVPDSPMGIVTAAQQAGLEAGRGEGQWEQWLGLEPQPVVISGEWVFVYPLDGSITTEALQANLIAQPTEEPGYQVWMSDQLAVRYSGADGGVVLFLISLFGEPVLGPGAAGEEPYPPAIPKTIRVIADALGVDPASVEILRYEETQWADACLEAPDPGELCAQVVTPGWLIFLKLEGDEIEARADVLGDQVRWDEP